MRDGNVVVRQEAVLCMLSLIHIQMCIRDSVIAGMTASQQNIVSGIVVIAATALGSISAKNKQE